MSAQEHLDSINEAMRKEWARLDRNENHSVRADVRVLDRRNIADSAHRNYGAAVVELERAEANLARLFSVLEKRTAELLETGTRAEPDWDRLPLCNSAHNVWMTERVGKAPIRTP